MDDGTVGHSVVFTYTPAALGPTAELVRNLEPLVKGDALAPAAVEQKLSRRFRLLGPQGLVGIALAAIDMALWDALARLHGVSLVATARRHGQARAGLRRRRLRRRGEVGARGGGLGEARLQGREGEDRLSDRSRRTSP